jgi:hypothetical protein
LTVLNAAEIGLIETALFAELDLRHAMRLPQEADTLAKGTRKGLLHPEDCPNLCLIHIHTNSYMRWIGRCAVLALVALTNLRSIP